MRPPDEVIRKVVAEWLRKADADFSLAEHLLSEGTVFSNAIVFNSQQAAEKYLKAFLSWHQIAFPKTHDLEELLDLAQTVDRGLAESLRDVIVLTPYGVELRYPGDRPDASSGEAREAVELARKVRDSVMKHPGIVISGTKPESKASKKKSKPKGSKPQHIDALPSPQSIEGLLAGLIPKGKPRRSALDKAQEIMYDAWEAPTRKRAVALAQRALAISGDCADAYALLAEETAVSPEQAIDLYRKGMEAGERALGKKAFKEDVGSFWGILETRPYMRARAGLARSLWLAGRREEAVGHYLDMLRLNPDDNQGIRDQLMPCLIEMGRVDEAENLFGQYPEDGMAVWMFSRALLNFRKHGASQAVDKSLKAALKENKLVPDYLLGRKKMPSRLPEFYGFGDDNEAVLYAYGNKAAWAATPGALEWLASKLK